MLENAYDIHFRELERALLDSEQIYRPTKWPQAVEGNFWDKKNAGKTMGNHLALIF